LAIEIEETGYLDFAVKDENGETKEVKIDLLFALGEIAKIGQSLSSQDGRLPDMNAYFDQLKDFLVHQGFPATISLRTAQTVVDRLRQEELGLVGKPVPDSATTN
jgi:hypothetical protein